MDVPEFQPPASHVETFHRGAGAYGRGIAGFTRVTAELLLAETSLAPGDVVVDLGTGPGPLVAVAQSLGARSIGVDLAQGMLVQARARVPGARWIRASCTTLPFASNSADVVAAAYTYGCVARGGTMSAEILRVLRPGGRLAFTNWIPAECMNVQILMRAVERAGDPNVPPAPAQAPGLFPDEAGYWRAVRSAGLEAGRIEKRSLVWSMSSRYELFDSLLEINPRLQGHSASHLAEIRELSADLVDAYAQGERYAVPMGIMFGWALRAR
jgi:SAM-dependent methyltransferase